MMSHDVALTERTSEAEQAVLASVLLAPETLGTVAAIVAPADFYHRPHARIFDAMLEIAARGWFVDPVTLSERLTERGELEAVGGKDFIAYLLDVVPSAANVAYYARLVAEHAQRRALVDLLERNLATGRDLAIEPSAVAAQLRAHCDGFLAVVEGTRLGQAVRAIDAPQPVAIQWAVEDVWPAGEIGLLVGDGGSFKSTVAVHIAGAMAGGYRVFDRFQTTQGPALIVSAEDPADVVLMRLQAFVQGHGWDARAVLEGVHIIADPEASLGDARWQQHIAREAARVGAAFVVLDPLADLLDGDENSNSELRPIVKYLRRLGRETGAAIGVVHHAGKASADKRTLDRVRGASALASAARTILFFDYNADGVGVEHLKMSRAPKLEKFMLQRRIDSAPDNRAAWLSARLGYETARVASRTRGEEFVFAQVMGSPRKLSTSDLKRAAQGTGISGEDISLAISALSARGAIDAVPGERGAKLWFSIMPPPALVEVA